MFRPFLFQRGRGKDGGVRAELDKQIQGGFFIGQGKVNGLIYLRVFALQHLSAVLKEQIAALAAHYATQQQHVLKAVQVKIICKGVAQIYAALVSLWLPPALRNPNRIQFVSI